jgi:D-lactate dehydrogenase
MRIADEVITPIDWKCCGFAGDRGLLVPELTSNATKLEVAEIENLDGVFVSNNQPCQIGLNGATDKNYISIIEAWIGAIK